MSPEGMTSKLYIKEIKSYQGERENLDDHQEEETQLLLLPLTTSSCTHILYFLGYA